MKYGLIEVMLLNKDLTVRALHLLIAIDNADNINNSGSNGEIHHHNVDNVRSSNHHHHHHHHHSFQFGFEYRIFTITRLLYTIISHLQIIHSSIYQPFLIHCSNIPILGPILPRVTFQWSVLKSIIASLLSRNSGNK
jgi:hypothetical protein